MNESPVSPPAASNAPGQRVFIETFGCQMNLLDSELVKDQLVDLGYRFVDDADEADVVLFNTCSVRELSEHKVLSRLGRMRQRKLGGEDVIVGVLGCMAERAGAELAKNLPQIDLMCGPSELDRIPSLLENLRETRGKRAPQLALSGHTARRGKTQDAAMDRLEALDYGRAIDPDAQSSQAFVRITRGCNKFCSFCVVPYTRGPEVHRPADSIVDEVKRLAGAGIKEVTLLGQTINHYEHEGTSFATLLRRVHDEVSDLPRLRFLTSYPRDFTDEALDVMASSERICRFLHIPVQHGNNAVLQRMNRGYTREGYLDLIRRARERMPDVSILGDMIVGFPGETDADFEDSLSLLREVRYKNVFVFKYSPRPGTVAQKRDVDDVPEAVKKERNNIMLKLQQEISREHHDAMVGKTFRVLVEGSAKNDPHRESRPRDKDGTELLSIGSKKQSATQTVRLSSRTTGDHIVAFDGPASLVGSLVDVRITRASNLSLQGELA